MFQWRDTPRCRVEHLVEDAASRKVWCLMEGQIMPQTSVDGVKD